MEIPIKKAGNFSLPILGFGTYPMGVDTKNRKKEISAIKRAINYGMIHIDTAEMYGWGKAEEYVGEVIQKYRRENILLTTKLFPKYKNFNETIKAIKRNLQRLNTEYIDLFLLHGVSPLISVQESMSAINEMQKRGYIKNIGVSNLDTPLLKEAIKYAPIVNNQIHFSLSARGYEQNGTIDFCKKNNILVTAYRPIGKTGEMSRSSNQLLNDMAKKYKKTITQVALNWVMQQKNIVTIFKASHKDHFNENVGSLGWKLSAKDSKQLKENFPCGVTVNIGSDFIKRNKEFFNESYS